MVLKFDLTRETLILKKASVQGGVEFVEAL
jgi:hypothetical protein